MPLDALARRVRARRRFARSASRTIDSAMSDSTSPSRFAHVDAMRAVAVLFVMWTHYAELFDNLAGSQHVLDALQRSVNFGRIGVVIFFCISGMLIPTSLRGAPSEGTRRFVVRRFFRLYPAFWLSLPLGYLVYWLLFGLRMDATGLLSNLTMIPTVFGRDPVMGHYWTLETELYFYVLCVLLFNIDALHRMRALCAVCAGLCVLFVVTSALRIVPADALGQYKGMLYHLAIMFWGACFRQAYEAPLKTFATMRGRIPLTYRAATIALGVLIVAISLLMAAANWRHRDFVHVSASLGYVFGVAIFVALATVLKIRLRLFAWLGEISYSIYLLHGIPLYLLLWMCERHGITDLPLGVYMALPVLPAIALSWVSYRFCEAPFVRFAHALTPKRRVDAATAKV